MVEQPGHDVMYEASDLPAWVRWDVERRSFYVQVAVQPGPDRRVLTLAVDSLIALDGREGDAKPLPLDGVRWAEAWEPRSGTYSVNVGVLPGDAMCVQVGLRYAHGARVLDAGLDQVG
jgi:hypothetical protein